MRNQKNIYEANKYSDVLFSITFTLLIITMLQNHLTVVIPCCFAGLMTTFISLSDENLRLKASLFPKNITIKYLSTVFVSQTLSMVTAFIAMNYFGVIEIISKLCGYKIN